MLRVIPMLVIDVEYILLGIRTVTGNFICHLFLLFNRNQQLYPAFVLCTELDLLGIRYYDQDILLYCFD